MVYLSSDLSPTTTPSHVPWRRCSSEAAGAGVEAVGGAEAVGRVGAVGAGVVQPAFKPRRRNGRSRESPVKPSDFLRVIFWSFGFRCFPYDFTTSAAALILAGGILATGHLAF